MEKRIKQIKGWTRYYVDWMTRLGLLRFSLLLATLLIILAGGIQLGITLIMTHSVDKVDLVRSVFFGLLVTPWAVYFLSAVVEQLEDSRQRLSQLVHKLQEMRERDLQLNVQLEEKIELLNQQIEATHQVEQARQQAIEDLESEVYHREKAQLELEERSALLRSYVDSSPDLVYYRDERGRFSGCNRAMESLTGRSELELIGLTPFEVYSTEIAVKIVQTDEEVFRSNKALTYEQWLEHQDGRKICYELRKVPFFDRKGRRLGLLGFGRDITERKRYQEQLEKASRDKTTFISTISHELRTPLNGIVGLSRMLLDSPLTADQYQHMKTIHLSAVTLGHIFNDIIDLDKLDRRRFSIVKVPLDFMSFLTDLETLARLQAEQKGLTLIFEQQGEMPDWIDADGTRLRQVLWNLIGNAIKFTERGIVKILCTVQQDQQGDYQICFEVQDTGIGIPLEQQRKIFAMYYQVQGTQQATGTGIGLAITSQLMEAMSGSIRVMSQPEQGSRFIATFPAAACAAPIEEKSLIEQKLLILLVEDVELNITVASAVLEKMGHQVMVARDGSEALALSRCQNFELILLDIQLPDMSGFEVAQRLRECLGDETPPLVALTANLVRDQHQYYEQGMDAALSKPLSRKALTRVLNELYTQKRSPAHAILSRPEIPESGNSYLDLEFLNDYAQTVGKKVLLSSVDLFEQAMPIYLEVLESNLIAKDKEKIVSEAHKIKGAAGSVALRRVSELAQQIQSPDLPAWWENVPDWVESLKRAYPRDLQRLRDWLAE